MEYDRRGQKEPPGILRIKSFFAVGTPYNPSIKQGTAFIGCGKLGNG
jgi:hypothetical protein